MKRLLLFFSFAVAAFAQNAVMLPWTPQQFTNTNGTILVSGKVCSFLAGTSTGTATFTDSTASVSNAIPPNAILLDSTGRPTSGGIWLTPNKAYKIVTMTAGSDGTCNTGIVVKTQDNVVATGNTFSQLNGCQYVNGTQTLTAAIAATVAPGCIVVTAPYVMTANNTIPIGVSLTVQESGLITTTGFTLTVNGAIQAGNYQIFAGTGTVSIASSGTPLNVLWFPGATMDVQANNAIASLTNGGFIDFRPYGASTQTLAATVIVGKANKSPVTVWFDRSTQFNCTITNTTPCIVVNGNGTLVGFGTQANSGSTGLVIGATSTVSDGLLIQGNQGTNQVGSYIEGLTVQSASGAVVSDALCAVQNTLQLTNIVNLSCVGGSTNTIGLKIYATGGTNGLTNPVIHNVNVDMQGNTGSRPIWIGCAASGTITPSSCSNSIQSINFYGGLATHPGSGGLAIITVEGQNGAGGTNIIQNVNLFGFQIESSNTTDIGVLDDGGSSLNVHGIFASCRTNCGADLIKVTQPAGTTIDGFFANGITNAGWTNTFHATGGITSQTVTQAQCPNGCGPIKFTKSGLTQAFLYADNAGVQLQADQNGISSRQLNTIEVGVPSGITGTDVCYGDSTAHNIRCNLNNTGFGPLVTASPCTTSQKTETAADTNLLTCAIPAQAGSYRIRFVLNVSAASAATLGWTISYTDSNGTAITNQNIDLFAYGTAAPAFTFTTSAALDMYGYADIDVSNAGAAIVVKLTFSGTSFTAKASATVERII